MPNYNLRVTEVLQSLLEPVQRQSNIILSLSSWLTGVQQVANTFSESVIPETTYWGNINSSKGAFEWYLNNEYNIATYSAYEPIFIGTLEQPTLAIYCYNGITENQYQPLYFLQRMPGFPNSVNTLGVTYYNTTFTYTTQKMVWFGDPGFQTILYTFQNNGTQSIPPNTPPIENGVFVNQGKWQLATYGFNELVASTTGEDYDFIVWCPTYLNVGDFNIRITAFVEKYKLAHLNFVVRYY
jgi:hypothetical protein